MGCSKNDQKIFIGNLYRARETRTYFKCITSYSLTHTLSLSLFQTHTHAHAHTKLEFDEGGDLLSLSSVMLVRRYQRWNVMSPTGKTKSRTWLGIFQTENCCCCYCCCCFCCNCCCYCCCYCYFYCSCYCCCCKNQFTSVNTYWGIYYLSISFQLVINTSYHTPPSKKQQQQ